MTLQRFAFEPQFYAGMSPLTAPIGARFPGLNPGNQFNYATRFAPGGQVSNLSLGEVAGVGKLFNSGGQLLAGFANQVVFNFVGKNPIQPTVQSSLPLTFVQPFLRGGGRAVILENLTLAERTLLYQVRAFAKFRQEFIVTVLDRRSGSELRPELQPLRLLAAGNIDPVVGFIPVVVDLAADRHRSQERRRLRAARPALRAADPGRGVGPVAAPGRPGRSEPRARPVDAGARHADLSDPTSTS